MANRRMFAKTITNSSRFLMMPLSAQALYFQLGMNADDDGYVEHFTIMRMVGGNPDDLNLLVAKSFVKVFDNHVLVIIEWEQHNKIQPSRKIASQYIDVYPSSTECQQVVNNTPTQVRLGKGSIGKEREEKKINKKKETISLPDWLDKEAWEAWVNYRNEIRKKLTPSMIKKQIAFLEKDKEHHKGIMDRSIMNGWTGLFPLDNQTAGDKAKKPVTAPSYSRDYTQEKK